MSRCMGVQRQTMATSRLKESLKVRRVWIECLFHRLQIVPPYPVARTDFTIILAVCELTS
jgi:hypothetical protein